MAFIKIVLTAMLLAAINSYALFAQPGNNGKFCPALASLPTNSTLDEIPKSRQRFELHECEGNTVVVYAFDRGKQQPSLIFDTGDGYPLYMLQVQNVLVLQSPGGSADHIYVFAFQGGKPRLAWQTATKDLVQVTQSQKNVTVAVPSSTFPGPDGKIPKEPLVKRSFMIEMR